MILRPRAFFSTLLIAALASSCNSVLPAPTSVAPGPTPALGIGLLHASYSPTALVAGDEDRRAMRTVQRKSKRKIFHSPGLNIGVKATLSDVLGDLDGNTIYQNDATPPDEFLFLPDVEASEGFGFDLGFRWESFEMILAWQETQYDADFNGARKDTTISYVDLLFREYFWIDSHIQPFAVAGLGFSDANISRGAQDAGNNLSTGGLENGINVNLGAGLAFYVSPKLSLFGQLMYRFGRYETLDTSAGNVRVDGSVDSDAWELSFGVSFNLLDPWE